MSRTRRVLTGAVAAVIAFPMDTQAVPVNPVGEPSDARLSSIGEMMKAVRQWASSSMGQKPSDSSQAARREITGLKSTPSGLVSYDVASSPAIPRLSLSPERSISAQDYALDVRMQKLLDEKVIAARPSPPVAVESKLRELLKIRQKPAGALEQTKPVPIVKKGKVDREPVDGIVLVGSGDAKLALKKFVPLTPEESRYLSGRLLLQKGDQCPTAMGLFHKLTKTKGWEAEAHYYLAVCSKQLKISTDFYEHAARVLKTQDTYYSKKIIEGLGSDIPYELANSLGEALLKVAGDGKILKELSDSVVADVAYVLADYGASNSKFKTTLAWAGKVPATHAKFLQAQFLLALAEYQVGSKENATQIQDQIVKAPQTDVAKQEFQALVALNAGRMHFQERDFKSALENYQHVYKDHPLWLQSLTEVGWTQLMNGDHEGALGNMHSIQSPFFAAVYKPESYVIRTIGYLNLCQYGDAYRALTILEKDYRPYLGKVERYLAQQSKADPYQTVKNFLKSPKATGDVDGLPAPVVREIARHRDFTNLQKAFNRQLDEKPLYGQFDGQVERELKIAQAAVAETRARIEDIRKRLATAQKRQDRQAASELTLALEAQFARLNDQFFAIDLYTEAKAGMAEYRQEVIGGIDKRLSAMRSKLGQVLGKRLERLKIELARILDNNELLRYEVFAGSGENIRFQVAGGAVENRIPASVLPKSKSLQWDFDGEYWEDEIGHFRSSLKNNCPERHVQARNGGDEP